MSIHRTMNIINHVKLFLTTFSICLITGLTQPAYAVFDPVNDDTDIFLANPVAVVNRPNVLIFLDNTANWNTAFDNEKSALVSVVNSLSEEFNVGLMFFPETGGGNDSIDGAYVRYGVRQMTGANKAVLAAGVASLDRTADAGNNNTLSEGMVEVYRYFTGKASIGSHGKQKTDFDGNTNVTNNPSFSSPFNSGLTDGFALGPTPTATSLYNSPISAACQDSFVIYISNGGANENNSSLTRAENELAAAGYDTSSTISLTPNGQEGSWMDEWAKYLANADLNGADDGEPHVYTYVIEIDPVATGQGDDMTALMKSVAANGKGDYFAVSSGNAGQAIVNALNAIFQEIQAVNSVFAAATLPVSVNVRGTNLNQVYIGVFRPDATKNPRWFGNLKAYQLGFSNNTLFLAGAQTDVNGDPVSVESSTGFIESSAVSHWTTTSSFWGFRDADENGDGGASDSPDGDLVEKGGAAQRLRTQFAASQATRNLYTCTSGGSSSSDDCDNSGDLLSGTPFASSNDDITAASLGLGTTIVENLTAFVTQSVESIDDSQEVTGLTTVTNIPVTINSFATNAVSAFIQSITTGGPQAIGSMTNNPNINPITAMVRNNNATKKPVTGTTQNPHGLSVGNPVTVSGFNSDPEYNGTFTVTATPTANTFQYSPPGTPGNNPDVTNAVISTTSSIVTVTLNNHGFSNGQSITIAGTTPSDFNGTYTIQNVTTNTFTFTTAAALTAIDTTNGIGTPGTAAGPSSIATATTTAAHGFIPAANVTISGATVSSYNGTRLISTTPTPTTFTFDVGVVGLAAEGAGARAAQNQGSKTVTASTGSALNVAGLTVGDTVTITGAATGYNGSFVVTSLNTPAAGDFTFEPTNPLPSTISSGSFTAGANSTVATATVPAHGFSIGDTITISGATPTEYNGEHTIVAFPVPTGNTFAFSVAPATPDPATGIITVRKGGATDDITANVTKTAHGYSAGDVITIAGATPAAYNGQFTVLASPAPTANTFSYTVTGEKTTQGPATGNITVSEQSNTAFATIPNHGLGDGSGATDADNTVSGVSIAGANEAAFNKTNTDVIVVDSSTIKYTLASVQGNATGSQILASFGTVSGSAVTDLLNWVRGADNTEDEDADTLNTDIRSTIHGDVLHSRPAVVNYNRHGNDDDVYIFYGSNDGIFRAVKGGLGSDPSDLLTTNSEPIPGQEAWGFIPEEHFSSLSRLRNNSPTISSSFKKPYFMDGSLGTYVLDVDNDGILGETDAINGDDKVWIFTSNHRGGRFIYALDVSNPSTPKFLWSRSNADPGWAELGQTWSVPQVRTIAANSGKPVLIFGAGYDPTVDDLDPATITAVNTNTSSTNPGAVTANSFEYNRSMGRGIFVVDAETGDIVVQIGPPGSDPGTSDPYISVTDMFYSIPSDIAIITDRNGSVDNRMYVGDTGGNLWRVDMADASVSNWKVTKIAEIADTTATDANGNLSGLRKFLFPPDVVYGDGEFNGGSDFDSILIGSGDREHPFDSTVQNRFYMIKDEGTAPLAAAGTAVTSNLDEDDLFDATNNCVQDTTQSCGGVTSDLNNDGVVDAADAALAINTEDGWYITLLPGEKVVGNAVTLNSITFFNTNEPTSAASTSCNSDLGTARQYQVRYGNATVLEDKNVDGSLTAADRGVIKPGGGYLPSPVPVVVEIDGVIHEGVISGTTVDQPPGAALGARLRKFWYKEIED